MQTFIELWSAKEAWLKMTYDWVESVTFKKIDGEWKMNFLHSTVRK